MFLSVKTPVSALGYSKAREAAKRVVFQQDLRGIMVASDYDLMN